MDSKIDFVGTWREHKAEVERDTADAMRLPVFSPLRPVATWSGLLAGLVGLAGGIVSSMVCALAAYGLVMLPGLMVRLLIGIAPGPFARLARRLGYTSGARRSPSSPA